ncbi:MAG: acyl-CoA dehydrogenase family protein, partial [Microthrixaceae bacterium]
DLDFTSEQDMLREMVRGLCEQYASDDSIRALEDDEVGYSTDMWTQLAELGMVGLLLPEQYGGAGSTMVDGVVLYEELGRSLAPTPHLESAVLCGGALLRSASEAHKDEWLPGIASGEKILVPAWVEPDNGYGPLGVQMRAVESGGGYTLTGTKYLVRFASSADRLVVLARTGDADTDIDLFLVDPAADGVTVGQRHSISSDNQYRVDFDGVAVSDADRIGAAGSGWATWDSAMVDAMTLAAAQANGGCEHALEITVQYSKDREQFDKPLGAFQALSHYMADARTSVDGAKMITYEAAWAIDRVNADEPEPARRYAAMAKLFSCNTYRDTTAMAQQIFGGVGFTLEYEVQLYFRRAKALQLSYNDTRRCEQIVAEEVLD